MMKITNPEGIQQARTEKAHSKKDPLGAANFSYALREALKKPDLTVCRNPGQFKTLEKRTSKPIMWIKHHG